MSAWQEFEKKIVENGKYDQFVDDKQKVASCGSWMQKIGGLWVRAIKEPTFHQKVWGLGWQQRQSAKIWVIRWQQRWKWGVFGALHPRHLHNGSAPQEDMVYINRQ